jgi:uncharacterized membrane protein
VRLFRLIDSFKAFPLIYVLTNGGPGSVTEVTNYYGFIQAFNFSYWGYASAIAMVILTGVFVLSWLVGRLGWNRHDSASPAFRASTWIAPTCWRTPGMRRRRRPAATRMGAPACARVTALALLLVLMFPFLWLVQLAFRPAADIFDDALLFTPTLEAFTSLLQGNFAQVLRQQPAGEHAVDGLSLVIGVPAAYALTRWNFRAATRRSRCGSW